ncbi:hypothetical protein [Cupriavidus sp. TMH.W2]|uniref:hypothetical protein n=1 Tax=Cupriavidus sp. TMH.W2 TaxID=3434465 RepID=UPI003D76FD10
MVDTTPPTIAELADLKEKAIKAVSAAISFISDIDSTLAMIDGLMYVMQPFKSGRIGIKFIKNNGKLRPQARVFRQLRSRRWVSDYVNHKGLVRRVRKSREFEANHQLLRTLCEHVTNLIQMRMDMVDRLKVADMSFTNTLKARGAYMKQTSSLIGAMHERIAERFEGEMEMDDE